MIFPSEKLLRFLEYKSNVSDLFLSPARVPHIVGLVLEAEPSGTAVLMMQTPRKTMLL